MRQDSRSGKQIVAKGMDPDSSHCALHIMHCALIGREKDLEISLPAKQCGMRNAQLAMLSRARLV
jgi:hypothetical protein